MAFFEKALEGKVMSTHILIRANISKQILYEAYAIARDFESRYSAYKEESFLSQVNRNAGKKPLPCTKDDRELFQRCIEASRLSEGKFDITIGALSHGAYHFGFNDQKVATPQEVGRKKSLVNYKMIHLDEKGIYLEKAGSAGKYYRDALLVSNGEVD